MAPIKDHPNRYALSGELHARPFPAMSVPAGVDKDGLPLGLQIITPALDEETMFKVGAAIEDSAGFVAKPENWWS